jgi:hypothetical protein
VPVYILYSFQSNIISAAHDYQPVSITKKLYILETVKTEDTSGVYASFVIIDEVGQAVVFECKESYRTMDLKSIDWAETGYDIIVGSGDVGTVRYAYVDGTWAKD